MQDLSSEAAATGNLPCRHLHIKGIFSSPLPSAVGIKDKVKVTLPLGLSLNVNDAG